MTIKSDISKAFDKVEWTFLRHIILALGFHSSFVNIVFRCVSTVSYTFLMNGFQDIRFGNLLVYCKKLNIVEASLAVV